jgi:5-methyltetrahydropteroyltriglutamate--homocysteine methyltransferase
MELTKDEIKAVKTAYNIIAGDYKINLFTYYDDVDFLNELYDLPIASIGLDFVHGIDNYKNIKNFPKDKTLIAGIVNGRNVWKTNINWAIEMLNDLSKYAENIMISNAGPLYHLPISIKSEINLDKNLFERLSFAEEKLEELRIISEIFNGKPISKQAPLTQSKNTQVTARIKNLTEKNFSRTETYNNRAKIQKQFLNLPIFPTTTIGSFPQTQDIRKIRNDYKSNKISKSDHDNFIYKKITETIGLQNELGLDVLVHGEFERSDMVEFFAQKLDGITTTQNGWILSYGTRCYRPPIIYGDISRPSSMTVDEISFAQSKTDKPVKGMLTGPTTIIAWSYAREDIPISEVAYQIALCLSDEIKDYENNNIKIVQIDEPAFREKAPIKKRNWNEYFNWAVRAFNLACSSASSKTQIHTHMCYSEFGEIIDKINELDFDVILIEATRSKGEIIKNFENIKFTKQIGVGIWDIHSPVVPSLDDMRKIVSRSLDVLPKENFWINPDCGLKTRTWEEILPCLKNIVTLAKELRK